MQIDYTAHLRLLLWPERFAVCRLEPNAPLADWMWRGSCVSVTRTPSELSVVCAESSVPASVRCERGWRGLMVQGPLDFALVGVLASLTKALAAAQVPLLALSTYDTDILLVKEGILPRAIAALREAGYDILPASV